ncbi:MAG: hypothetical protein WC205_04260 [Opitutaceae bacterium]|jgi:hypothetical protein
MPGFSFLMRTVTYKSVLRGVLKREAGGNLVSDDGAALLVIEYIADRYLSAWEYYVWPECFETEYRLFRAEYDADLTYAEGVELYFEDSAGVGAYYTALEAIGVGESPESDPDSWEVLTTLRRFVAFDQAGETEFEACVGAWDRDPEADKGALRMAYSITSDGVLISPACTLNGVWLKIRKVCPDFSAVIYDATDTYAVGDVVYFEDFAECYRVLEATTAAQTPGTHPAKFAVLEFAKIFARAVKAGALADWQRSDGEGSAVKTRDSEERFTELLDEQVWQLTKLQGQTGKPDYEV